MLANNSLACIAVDRRRGHTPRASGSGRVVGGIRHRESDGCDAGGNNAMLLSRVGAEIDLLLEFPGGELLAVEIKRGLAPRA